MNININGNQGKLFQGADFVQGVQDVKKPQDNALKTGVGEFEIVEDLEVRPDRSPDVEAHSTFIDKLFEKAVVANQDKVTLGKELSELSDERTLDAPSLQEAEEARSAAETAMHELDLFSGRELVEAFRSPDFDKSEPGMAFMKAIEKQMALADKLAECSRKSGNVLELNEMSMQANLRAAELSRLLGELDQAQEGDTRLDKTGLSSELSRIGVESHGNRDALEFLEGKLQIKRLSAFTMEDKCLTPDQVTLLRTKLVDLKNDVKDARKHGIDFVGDGKSRTMVDPAVFKAIEAELAKMESRLEGFEKKYIVAELHRFADELRAPDFITDILQCVTDLKDSGKSVEPGVVDELKALVRSYDEMRDRIVQYADDCILNGVKPDKNVLDQISNTFNVQILDQTCKACKHVLGKDVFELPESFKQITFSDNSVKNPWKLAIDDGKIGKVIRFEYAPVVEDIGDVIEHWADPSTERIALRKADVRALMYDDKVSLTDHIEALVHGLDDSAVDTEISGLEPKSVQPLGSGASSTAYLCTFEVNGKEVQRVFKPESTAHYGLAHGVRSRFSEKLAFQNALHFNMATHKVSEMLDIGSRNMSAKIGTLKGKFGMFLEVAPGVSPSDIADKEKTSFGKDGIEAKKFVQKNCDAFMTNDANYKRKLYKAGAEIAKQFNELQWLDLITGQLDRHNSNYHLYIPKDIGETNKIRVTGIDNDATFPENNTEAGKITLSKEIMKDLAPSFTRVSHMSIEEYFQDDEGNPLMTRNKDDSSVTFDLQNMSNRQRFGFLNWSGMRNGMVPRYVDKQLADKIDHFANTPEGQREFVTELKRCGLTEKQIEAAKKRLESVDAIIKKKSPMILMESTDWIELARLKLISPNANSVVKGAYNMTQDDYFMRYQIQSIFTNA